MKKYSLLDVFRILCACLVVLIHIGTSSKTPVATMLVSCFSRQAVPFFFIVSGFFFIRNLDSTDNKSDFVLNYSRNAIVFYLLWVLILLPQSLTMYTQLYQGSSPLYIFSILLRRTFLAGTAQFWYLLALSETALIAGLLILKGRQKLLYCFSGTGFLLGMVYAMQIPLPFFNMYNRLVYVFFSWQNNFLMTGLPFFSIGIALFRYVQGKQFRISNLCVLYLLVSCISIFLYYFALRSHIAPDRILFLFPFQAILLFLIGLYCTNCSLLQKVSPHCRACSGTVYCLHSLVIEYFLGDIVPWSDIFIVNYITVVAVCVLAYLAVTAIAWKPLYRLVTLK